MKSFLTALLLSAISALCFAQAQPDEEAIRSLRAVSNQAIASGDATSFAATLEPEFVVVTGNGSFLTREAYIAVFAKDFEDPHSVRFERIIDSVDISTSVPLAAEYGHWIGHVPGGPPIFRGTYLAMWRRAASASGPGSSSGPGPGPGSGWMLRSELFVSLSCSDSAACEIYQRKYAVTPANSPKIAK